MRATDIRPDQLIKRYWELAAADAQRFRARSDYELEQIPCVACGFSDSIYKFSKDGFDYHECPKCGTLYQTPRPPQAAFEEYYRSSEASDYWANVFFPAVAEVRRDKIFRPRAESLLSWAEQRGIRVGTLVDVGAGFGILIEEWRKLSPGVRALAIEPSASMAQVCRDKGIDVIEDMIENVLADQIQADLVCCFEVIEHVHDPLSFLGSLFKLARPGGVVFVSTLCIDGFDLQVQGADSPQIYPPTHINFFSVRGFEELFQRAGFSEVEVATPGKLDVDIVRKYIDQKPEILARQPFLKNLIRPGVGEEFQQFLARNRLISHAWVYGIKGS